MAPRLWVGSRKKRARRGCFGKAQAGHHVKGTASMEDQFLGSVLTFVVTCSDLLSNYGPESDTLVAIIRSVWN